MADRYEGPERRSARYVEGAQLHRWASVFGVIIGIIATVVGSFVSYSLTTRSMVYDDRVLIYERLGKLESTRDQEMATLNGISERLNNLVNLQIQRGR